MVEIGSNLADLLKLMAFLAAWTMILWVALR